MRALAAIIDERSPRRVSGGYHCRMAEPFVFARSTEGADVLFRPGLANRHGLITGATGTGKTVSLQVLADNFSRLGVPVFLADVKGDLTGLAAAGTLTP